VKDVYGDMLFSAPIVAVNVAHPLLMYMKDELQSKQRKFTFLVGHDSNIASILSALEVEEYSLPNTIEKKTPIGSKLVFEKWQDKQTKEEFISINLIYQTTDQLRHLELLTLSNPPACYPLKFSGLSANEFGLYKFNDVVERFDQAILAYDDIK
jgi:glucose-1-phosphatase